MIGATHMSRARCGTCNHEFDTCALPAPIELAVKAMTRPCPICGETKTYLGNSRPLTAEEKDASQRALLGPLGGASKNFKVET